MRWFRQTFQKSRLFLLGFLLVETFFLIDGQQFVYAYQVDQQKKETALKSFAETFGIPVEKLRGEERTRPAPRSGEAKPLPLHHVEKKARTQEGRAADPRAKSVGGSPSVPRKAPVGTLWEGAGTSWDQAWLLRDLLTAAGVDARFEWGEIEITTEMLQNITGVEDPFRAGDLLTTAGTPIVLVVSGSQVDGTLVETVYDVDGYRVQTHVKLPGGDSEVIDYLVDARGLLGHVVAEIIDGEVRTVYTRSDDELISLLRPASNGLGELAKHEESPEGLYRSTQDDFMRLQEWLLR